MSIESVLKNYKIIDLSHTMEEDMPRPQVPYGHIPWKSYAKGDAFNTNMFLVFEHAGTHVDAPIHLGGVEGQSIDQIPSESWIGSCLVLDMSYKAENEEVSAKEILEWEDKHGKIDEGSIVLFYYDWERNWTTKHGVENQPYLKNNPGLSEAAAKLLQKDQAEAQQKQAQQQQQDPLTQIQQRELAIKEQELQHKIQMDTAKLQIEAQAKMENIELQKDRLESEEKRDGARLGVKIAQELEKNKEKAISEGTKIGLQMARELTNGGDNV